MMDNGKSIDDYWTPYGGGMNIKKAIEKLDEISDFKKRPGMSIGITSNSLREILLALDEKDEQKEVNMFHIKLIDSLMKDVKDIERRVGELEHGRANNWKTEKTEVVHDEGKVYCDRDLCVNNDSCEECPAGDKPSPKVKEEKPCEHNWGTFYCMKCGVPNVDGSSDTITIPRSVAEKWLEYAEKYDLEEDRKIVAAIKSALGGR